MAAVLVFYITIEFLWFFLISVDRLQHILGVPGPAVVAATELGLAALGGTITLLAHRQLPLLSGGQKRLALTVRAIAAMAAFGNTLFLLVVVLMILGVARD